MSDIKEYGFMMDHEEMAAFLDVHKLRGPSHGHDHIEALEEFAVKLLLHGYPEPMHFLDVTWHRHPWNLDRHPLGVQLTSEERARMTEFLRSWSST